MFWAWKYKLSIKKELKKADPKPVKEKDEEEVKKVIKNELKKADPKPIKEQDEENIISVQKKLSDSKVSEWEIKLSLGH